MCLPANCDNCNKVTWKGCGRHIEAVKEQFEPSNWCTCSEDDRRPGHLLEDLAS